MYPIETNQTDDTNKVYHLFIIIWIVSQFCTLTNSNYIIHLFSVSRKNNKQWKTSFSFSFSHSENRQTNKIKINSPFQCLFSIQFISLVLCFIFYLFIYGFFVLREIFVCTRVQDDVHEIDNIQQFTITIHDPRQVKGFIISLSLIVNELNIICRMENNETI